MIRCPPYQISETLCLPSLAAIFKRLKGRAYFDNKQNIFSLPLFPVFPNSLMSEHFQLR